MFVPETKEACLLLKISQSVSVKAPVVEVEAVAKDKAWVERERPLAVPMVTGE